jgi:hypothetical protein
MKPYTGSGMAFCVEKRADRWYNADVVIHLKKEHKKGRNHGNGRIQAGTGSGTGEASG